LSDNFIISITIPPTFHSHKSSSLQHITRLVGQHVLRNSVHFRDFAFDPVFGWTQESRR